MGQILKIVKSTYYYQINKCSTVNVNNYEQEVISAFNDSRKIYGARKIKAILTRKDIILLRRKIRQIMIKNQLVSKYTKWKLEIKKSSLLVKTDNPKKMLMELLRWKNLYRGFTEQNDYTANFQEKAKNMLQRETDALKKLANKEKEYLTFKKEQEINKLIQDANIDNQFINFVKNSINFENDIEVIKDDINNFVATMPKIKHTLDTGGVPNKADDKNTNPSNSEEIIFSSDALTPQELMFKRKGDK